MCVLLNSLWLQYALRQPTAIIIGVQGGPLIRNDLAAPPIAARWPFLCIYGPFWWAILSVRPPFWKLLLLLLLLVAVYLVRRVCFFPLTLLLRYCSANVVLLVCTWVWVCAVRCATFTTVYCWPHSRIALKLQFRRTEFMLCTHINKWKWLQIVSEHRLRLRWAAWLLLLLLCNERYLSNAHARLTNHDFSASSCSYASYWRFICFNFLFAHLFYNFSLNCWGLSVCVYTCVVLSYNAFLRLFLFPKVP